MGNVEEKIRKKLSNEEYEFALQLLKLSPSRVRSFIDEKAEESTK